MNNISKLSILAYGIALAIGAFLLRGTVGLNLADEGFLWYGAQRTLLGEIPTRDFQSYEPGRYYWIAGWMKLLGSNGLYPFRIASALFQSLGLALAVLLIFEETKSKFISILSGVVILLWMIPPHKDFDYTLSIFIVGATYLVLKNSGKNSALLAGIVLGFCTIFGRNHGLYGALTISIALCLSIYINRGQKFIDAFLRYGSGFFIGLLPIVILAIFSDGYFEALADSIRSLFYLGSTNLPLPVPYPWKVSFSSGYSWLAMSEFCVGIFFLLLPLFGLLGLILFLFRSSNLIANSPVFVAALLVSIPYTHYAYSRADFWHLALGIHPFLIGMFTIPNFFTRYFRLAITLIIAALSWIGMKNNNPYFVDTKDYVSHRIGNHNYLVAKDVEAQLNTFSRIAELAGPGGRVFVAPHSPGAYSLLGQKTATWESYFLFSRPDLVQQLEAKRLAEDPPKVVMLRDFPLDNREDLRFRNSHPLLWKYIAENYRQYPMEGLPPFETVYVSNNP